MNRLGCACLVSAMTALLGLSTAAKAEVRWTLSNVAFSDGATLTGSFETDTYGNLASFNMVLTGSAVGSATFDPANSTGYNFGINFFEVALPNSGTDIAHVQIQADVPFTGTNPITLNGGTNIWDGVGHYGVISGTVSGAAVDAPEPMSLGLLATGIAGLAARRRRLRRT